MECFTLAICKSNVSSSMLYFPAQPHLFTMTEVTISSVLLSPHHNNVMGWLGTNFELPTYLYGTPHKWLTIPYHSTPSKYCPRSWYNTRSYHQQDHRLQWDAPDAPGMMIMLIFALPRVIALGGTCIYLYFIIVCRLHPHVSEAVGRERESVQVQEGEVGLRKLILRYKK